jgi:hypothetical protein
LDPRVVGASDNYGGKYRTSLRNDLAVAPDDVTRHGNE